MQPDNTPIIAGAAQITERWQASGERLDPLGLMEAASRKALADAPGLVSAIDCVCVVNTLSWSYADAPGTLATRLGLAPVERVYTAIGGNSPQMLVHRAALALQRGERKAVLLVGAEAGCSAQRARKEGRDLGWPTLAQPERIDGDDRIGASALEFEYDLTLPSAMYPMIETVFRARAGRSPEEHAQFLGRLCEAFADVASRNPFAWFPTRRAAGEIATPSANNRYVGYPYTKLMNSILAVDQAAAVVLTTESTAAGLGLDREQWVYPMGGAALNDVWYVTERPRLDRSPAIRGAGAAALEQAGLRIDEIDTFDLYSCFPCAVQLACEALGISLEDPRGLTVTGGLPYFGGPGNNYTMHAIASVVERIRGGQSRNALVTALGWYATKHAAGVYGRERPRRPWTGDRLTELQAEIDATALPSPISVYDGSMDVEAFVVRHRKDGTPRSGTVLAREPGGARVLAAIDLAPQELEDLEAAEVVGKRWMCRHDTSSGKNLARPA